MSAAALDYTYDYEFASTVDDRGWRLATCQGRLLGDEFFRGKLRAPRSVAEMLLALTRVVRTHFFAARPPNLDPVVTSSPGMLRFEGFSGCCGVYVRVDLPPEAFVDDVRGHGTTNVDFNTEMQTQLVRLRDSDDIEFSVGRESFTLQRDDEQIVERKVKLPIRWIKGFSEVQVYQSRLRPVMTIAPAELKRFLLALPRGGKQINFIVQSGQSIRLSPRGRPGSIPLGGVERLRVLEPLLPQARKITAWLDEESGTSSWQVDGTSGRFLLVVCRELYRGFSGEGQVLQTLASSDWQHAVEPVQKLLDWQSTLDPAELAARTGLRTSEVIAALAVLGSRGLAGFDAVSGFYFHRELPFDLDRIEQLQPRLKDARKLLDQNGVRVVTTPGDEMWDVEVAGTDVNHFVRLRPDGDRCTCPWYGKHQGDRGPCKHVLAARMFVETDDEEQP